MARKKSYESDETGYSADEAEPDAEVQAEGEPKEAEELTDEQIAAYQPCDKPPLNPPTPAAVAGSVLKKAKEDHDAEAGGGEDPPPEEDVQIQDDGMYRVGQDCNVKGQAFTKGEAIFLEDDEVETLKAAGVKLLPPERDPRQMGPKARKAAGLDEAPKGENPQY